MCFIVSYTYQKKKKGEREFTPLNLLSGVQIGMSPSFSLCPVGLIPAVHAPCRSLAPALWDGGTERTLGSPSMCSHLSSRCAQQVQLAQLDRQHHGSATAARHQRCLAGNSDLAFAKKSCGNFTLEFTFS